ncbi:hypothetical protein [Bradyrhizobium japonicum]|uniref:hypothetical protein n=1 Tax=Bradyrhizobium japonicum TaxID=375 RepID=UPI0012BD2281|nr:hypothetical protein [Bradyrhizobium japonicum]
MTVYKSKNSPYYQFDFQRGGRRYNGSTKRTDRTEAEAVERALIERAEREAEVAFRAATSPELIAVLPRHVTRSPFKTGWRYSFSVPAKAQRAGCPLRSEVLGTDYDTAVARAEGVLLPALDKWWSDYHERELMSEIPGKPPIDLKSSPPWVGVYLLMLKGKVVYVGSSRRMPRRVETHRLNGRPFDDVFYIATDEHQRLKLEATLIKSLNPIQNRQWTNVNSDDVRSRTDSRAAQRKAS